MFAISEVHPTYLIVNFTRNTKGFVSLTEKGEDYHKHLEVGQLIVASVAQTGTSQFNVETSGLQNKKLQLLLTSDAINKSLTAENIVPNMVLQGEIVSKEAKGFILNFGLKDKTQGFLPIDPSTEHVQIGQTLAIVVKQVMTSSKIIKVELASSLKAEAKSLASKDLTIHNIKPGFLVAAKVSRIMDNGIELNFLGGFSGTVFVDHLENEPNKYKLGDKLSARVVTVDVMTQTITLSLLPHILKFENISSLLQTEGIAVGKLFEKVPVSQVAFGDSYRVTITPSITGFLHKIHAVKKEKEPKKKAKDADEVDEDEVKETKYERVELEKGQKIDRIRVKEINYFDGCPILSMRDDIIATVALNYDQITCG